MTDSPELSDSPPKLAAALRFSATIRKVDRAVARLEELQCVVRGSRTASTQAKDSSLCRPKLALHAEDRFPKRVISYRSATHSQHGSVSKPISCRNRKQERVPPHASSYKANADPVVVSRRTARVADISPALRQKQVCSSNAAMDMSVPARMPMPPTVLLSSPPSSACSSTVKVVTRKMKPHMDMAAPELSRASPANTSPGNLSLASSSKIPRTFFVHAGRANPNRPWCLSASPSPHATTSSTTSNYIDSPSSNSSTAPHLMKFPSRFSPLHRQSSGRKSHETLQSQPLLCKSPELSNKPIDASTMRPPRRTWFVQNRRSLPSFAPSSPRGKRPSRRFSLTSKVHEDSPPRPLPALITRLPTRRKQASSPVKIGSLRSMRKSSMDAGGFTPDASPLEGRTVMGRRPPSNTLQSPSSIRAAASPSPPIWPLPLPPALQARASGAPPKVKPSHKRSSSCPRQCFLPLAIDDGNSSSCSPPRQIKPSETPCLESRGKENCFSGCGPAAWPCVARSWSFSQREPGSDLTNCIGAGPYLLRHVRSYVQSGKKTTPHAQAYKMDSFMPGPDREQQKLYIG